MVVSNKISWKFHYSITQTSESNFLNVMAIISAALILTPSKIVLMMHI